MRPIRNRFLVLAFGLTLAPLALADDAKPKDKMDDAPMTIHGVISDFTVIGETDVDETTGKVMTAEATLVTVIGHPHHDRSLSTALAKAEKEGAEIKAGKEVGIEDRAKPEMGGRGNRNRMNVYVVAISPKTKVCDMTPDGKDVEIKLDQMEVGDHVELVFDPKVMAKSSGKEEPKKGEMKHGRHRTYYGAATGIKLLGEPIEGESGKK